MEPQKSEVLQPDEFEGVGLDLDEVTTVSRRRILVVEDEQDILILLKEILRMSGFNVLSATNGHEALKKVVEFNPDLVLLDLRLPDMDGWGTLHHLRKISDIPVIIVSALGAKENVIRGLRSGVDDYITKPFDNDEVVERVKAVLRRARKSQDITRLVFPKVGLIVDLNSTEVTLDNKVIILTPKEFAVLSILAKNAPSIVGYQVISEAIWGEDSEMIRKRAKYLVYLLRRKFERVKPELKLILNIDRQGYKLQTAED